MTEQQQKILCDPQTSGGLLVAVSAYAEDEFLQVANEHGLQLKAIGEITESSSARGKTPLIEIN